MECEEPAIYTQPKERMKDEYVDDEINNNNNYGYGRDGKLWQIIKFAHM